MKYLYAEDYIGISKERGHREAIKTLKKDLGTKGSLYCLPMRKKAGKNDNSEMKASGYKIIIDGVEIATRSKPEDCCSVTVLFGMGKTIEQAEKAFITNLAKLKPENVKIRVTNLKTTEVPIVRQKQSDVVKKATCPLSAKKIKSADEWKKIIRKMCKIEIPDSVFNGKTATKTVYKIEAEEEFTMLPRRPRHATIKAKIPSPQFQDSRASLDTAIPA